MSSTACLDISCLTIASVTYRPISPRATAFLTTLSLASRCRWRPRFASSLLRPAFRKESKGTSSLTFGLFGHHVPSPTPALTLSVIQTRNWSLLEVILGRTSCLHTSCYNQPQSPLHTLNWKVQSFGP